jgi:catalase-peroxidase
LQKAWLQTNSQRHGTQFSRYLGPEVPNKELIWQDPIPKVDHKLVSSSEMTSIKNDITNSGISNSELISTAWASASTFRCTDKRGGGKWRQELL